MVGGQQKQVNAMKGLNILWQVKGGKIHEPGDPELTKDIIVLDGVHDGVGEALAEGHRLHKGGLQLRHVGRILNVS